LEFPPELVAEIQTLIDREKERSTPLLSKDGKALYVYGTIGCDCYVSPDGDVYIEGWDINMDVEVDRSRPAQITVLILGSKKLPKLAELLPKRPPETPDCVTCHGTGRIYQEVFRSSSGPGGILCHKCYGLGWIEA